MEQTLDTKSQHHTVDTFIACVSKELEESKPNNIPRDNLSPSERNALKELSNRDDIVITKADKGGATVILDEKDFINEANGHLQDQQNYRELNFNPTKDYTDIICNTLDEMERNEELDADIAEGLKSVEPKTPRLYL